MKNKSKTVFATIIIMLIFLITDLIVINKLGLPRKLSNNPIMINLNAPELDNTNQDDTFKLMTYNIHYGSGYKNDYIENAQGDDVYKYLDQVANIIKDADIVTLQEVDYNLGRSHFVNEMDYLADKSGFKYSHFSDNWNFKILPFLSPVYFTRLRTGHATLSKYPIENPQTLLFEKPHASIWHKWFFTWRTQQTIDVLFNEQKVRIFNVHLESEYGSDRISQAQQLKSWVEESNIPTILAGDFNALAEEASNKEFPGNDYENDTTMEIIRSTNLNQLFPKEVYLANEESFFTFPSKVANRKIDYVFYSDELSVLEGKLLSEHKDESDHIPTEVVFKIK